MTDQRNSSVLVMDLDGTLVRSDTTHELLILCMRWAPLMVPFVAFGLIFNRAATKRWLSERFGEHIDPAFLPYDAEALSLMKAHQESGGQIWLVSGSDHILVERIAGHVGGFDRYQGSSPGENLTSRRKASFLEQELEDFHYAGNSRQDFEVWKRSKSGYAFRAPGASKRLKNADGKPVSLVEVVPKSGMLGPLLKNLRLHQWAKNILIFATPALLFTTLTPADGVRLLLAFFSFGFMASGTYILNDLFDIQDDRRHKTKKFRPLADGRLSVPAALLAMFTLLAASVAGAWIVGPGFTVVLLIYAFVTITYSFRLKRIPIVDVFILAGLFTIRVWAGGVVLGVPTSAWFIMFVGLVFLSLALAKRFVEIQKSTSRKIAGRGYRHEDAPFVLAFGAGTGAVAVLTLAIYGLLAPNRLIDNPGIVLAVAAIIGAWFMRIWLIASRGELNDDPVLFAVKDRVSLACLAIVGGCFLVESGKSIWMNWL